MHLKLVIISFCALLAIHPATAQDYTSNAPSCHPSCHGSGLHLQRLRRGIVRCGVVPYGERRGGAKSGGDGVGGLVGGDWVQQPVYDERIVAKVSAGYNAGAWRSFHTGVQLLWFFAFQYIQGFVGIRQTTFQNYLRGHQPQLSQCSY